MGLGEVHPFVPLDAEELDTEGLQKQEEEEEELGILQYLDQLEQVTANMFWKYKQFVCLMTYQRCSAFKWDPQNISMINHCLNTFIQKLSLFIVHTLYISGFFLYPKQATQKVVQKLAVSGLAKGRQFEERWKRNMGTGLFLFKLLLYCGFREINEI